MDSESIKYDENVSYVSKIEKLPPDYVPWSAMYKQQDKSYDDMTDEEFEAEMEKARDAYMDIVHFNAEQELLDNVIKGGRHE